nr:hypothetical protein [Sphingomonas pituitosa]
MKSLLYRSRVKIGTKIVAGHASRSFDFQDEARGQRLTLFPGLVDCSGGAAANSGKRALRTCDLQRAIERGERG